MRLESCPVGQQYNEEQGSCIEAEYNVCSQPKSTAGLVGRTVNPCNGHVDGILVLDSSVYVKCHNHREMETHACSLGQKFDGRSCSDPDDCSGKHDGYHMVEDMNCKEYILCQNRRLVLHSTCPAGSAFDGQSCVSRRMVACPQKNKCSSLPDGVYPNTNNHCRSYYRCKDGKLAAEDSCSNGLIWNGHRCLKNGDFTCVEHTSSVDCYGKNGYIIDTTSGCKNYHYCNHGTKMSYVCPDGKVFNGYQCVPSDERLCPEQKDNVCEGRAPGYYTDPESNCRSYFYCARSSKITYVCAPEEVFNGVECVSKGVFTCPDMNLECSKRPNGYQRQGMSPRDYIYCSDGVKLATLQCDQSKVYDGEKCVDVNQFISACHNIRYGYLTDETCRLYYVCRDDIVVNSGVCPDGFVFDGKSCERKTSGKCNRGSLLTCSGAPNGFYQDLNSNCQKYFYCINGEKTDLSCPQGQVHNGDICVPRHRFVCPSVKITEFLR